MYSILVNEHCVITLSFSKWKKALISVIIKEFSHSSATLTTENGKNALKLKDEIIAETSKVLDFVLIDISW